MGRRICLARGALRSVRDSAGLSIHKGSRIGRVLENLENGSDGRFLPDDIAKAVPARQVQIMGIEELEDLAGRFHTQKGGENKIKTILHFAMGIFAHRASDITHQPNWEL